MLSQIQTIDRISSFFFVLFKPQAKKLFDLFSLAERKAKQGE